MFGGSVSAELGMRPKAFWTNPPGGDGPPAITSMSVRGDGLAALGISDGTKLVVERNAFGVKKACDWIPAKSRGNDGNDAGFPLRACGNDVAVLAPDRNIRG